MKIKTSASRKIGVLTGKFVATTVALPSKTANTSKSIKDEFLAGFAETSGSNKKMENASDESVDPFAAFSDHK